MISRTLSGRGVSSKLRVVADDHNLMADGADATRIVIQVTDEFGNIHTGADDPVTLNLKGPGELIGDNPLALVGGSAAVWVRAQETAGAVRLSVHHLRLGTQTVELTLDAVPAELV